MSKKMGPRETWEAVKELSYEIRDLYTKELIEKLISPEFVLGLTACKSWDIRLEFVREPLDGIFRLESYWIDGRCQSTLVFRCDHSQNNTLIWKEEPHILGLWEELYFDEPFGD